MTIQHSGIKAFRPMVMLTRLGQVCLTVLVIALVLYVGTLSIGMVAKQIDATIWFCSDKEGVIYTELGLLNCTKINKEGITSLTVMT